MKRDDHAVIAPSALERTVACPGWIKQAAGVPEVPPHESAAEGTAGHWVATTMKRGDGAGITRGVHAPNGVEVTDEMIDGGRMWVEALEGWPDTPETPVAIPRIHPECWGTPDSRQWNPAMHTLRVAEYKFGHRVVEVFENWQLIAYAAGVMDELRLHDDETILELMVVQPRAYHKDGPIRTWTVAATKLRAMINIAHGAAHEALSDNPHTASGPHCLDCPARSMCPTFDKAVGAILDWTGRADPVLKTAGDIGRELRLVEDAQQRLKARQTGLAAQAEALLRQGRAVPFYTLQEGVGRLAWTAPLAEVEALAQRGGKSVLAPPAMVTPTQARDRKLLPAEILAQYSERPRTGRVMVREETLGASKVFEKP